MWKDERGQVWRFWASSQFLGVREGLKCLCAKNVSTTGVPASAGMS